MQRYQLPATAWCTLPATTADRAARNLGWIRAFLARCDGRLWIDTESDRLAVHDLASKKRDRLQ